SAQNQVTFAEITDGFRVRFFAVDAAGNAETVKEARYDEDRVAPGAPLNLTAVFNAGTSDVDVAWESPLDADVEGFVLLTRPGEAPVVDFDRALPEEGAVLADGSTVRSVGSDTQASIPNITGRLVVAVVSFDAALNFSAPAFAVVDTPTEETGVATLSVDVTNDPPTVNVSNASATLPLEATATFDAGVLTVSITLENQTNAVLTNPKLVVTNVSEGTLSNAELTRDGQETVYFGPNSTGVGARASSDAVVDGVSGAAAVSFDVTLRTDPMLALNERRSDDGADLVDSGTMSVRAETGCGVLFNNGCAKSGVFSDDGRFLYLGHQGMPAIQRYDMTSGTFTDVQFTTVPPGSATVGNLAGSVEGLIRVGSSIVAAVSNTCPGSGRQQDAQELTVIRFDGTFFREEARLVLPVNSQHAHIAVNPAHTVLAGSNGPTYRLAAADETPTVVPNSASVGADVVLLHPDGERMYVAEDDRLVEFDFEGVEQGIAALQDARVGGHWGAISPF
ncbi:MAG: hypothetical protein AAFQ82_21675, partial [Myxococcota bacterium]